VWLVCGCVSVNWKTVVFLAIINDLMTCMREAVLVLYLWEARCLTMSKG